MENGGSTVSIGPGIGRQPSIALSFLKFGVMGLVLASVLRFVSGRADWFRAWSNQRHERYKPLVPGSWCPSAPWIAP